MYMPFFTNDFSSKSTHNSSPTVKILNIENAKICQLHKYIELKKLGRFQISFFF